MARLEVAEELGRFSLVTPVDNAHVNMHRLIQSVVQHQLLRRMHMPTASRWVLVWKQIFFAAKGSFLSSPFQCVRYPSS